MTVSALPSGLAPRIVAFCDELRREGVAVGTAEILDAFAALDQVPWTVEPDFREALAATVAKSQEDRRVFDLVFDRFFFRAAEAEALAQGITEQRRYGGSERLDLAELRDAIRQAIGAGRDGEMRDLARLAVAAFGQRGEGSGVTCSGSAGRSGSSRALRSEATSQRSIARASGASSAICGVSSSAGRSSAPSACRPRGRSRSSIGRYRRAPPRT